jgi:hypothetical protein
MLIVKRRLAVKPFSLDMLLYICPPNKFLSYIYAENRNFSNQFLDTKFEIFRTRNTKLETYFETVFKHET